MTAGSGDAYWTGLPDPEIDSEELGECCDAIVQQCQARGLTSYNVQVDTEALEPGVKQIVIVLTFAGRVQYHTVILRLPRILLTFPGDVAEEFIAAVDEILAAEAEDLRGRPR